MRRTFFLPQCLVLLAFAVFPSLGANSVLRVGGDEHFLDTHTDAGHCNTTVLAGNGGTNIDCRDSAGNRAFGNSVRGCLAVAGRGTCLSGPPPAKLATTQEIRCPGGNTFVITTGSASPRSSCVAFLDGAGAIKGGSCSETKTKNESLVDCALESGRGGCRSFTGLGACRCTTCGAKTSPIPAPR